MSVTELTTLADKMEVRHAQQAVDRKLVDGLHYEDEVLDLLKTKCGLSTSDKLNSISYRDYKKSGGGGKSSKNEIAVIVADGEIMPGNSDVGIVGSKTIVDALRKARESKRVKAVVLRINSPGGSAQASDDMWREITLLSKEKTIIASMGDVAASGGYYMAMGCDSIVAQPTTITGSIGVFSVLFDMSRFLENKVGITSQEVKTGEIGQLITFTRSLTESEKAIMQKQTEAVYETFTSKAAAGRNMTVDEIKKIASGRVWTGTQAKANGLVDVLGGLPDAIQLAANAENLGKDYTLRYYPKSKTLLEKILNVEESSTTDARISNALGGEQNILYRQYLKLKRLEGTQARMPFEFEVK
jgi:protease IV